jgi:hypothetical protein
MTTVRPAAGPVGEGPAAEVPRRETTVAGTVEVR